MSGKRSGSTRPTNSPPVPVARTRRRAPSQRVVPPRDASQSAFFYSDTLQIEVSALQPVRPVAHVRCTSPVNSAYQGNTQTKRLSQQWTILRSQKTILERLKDQILAGGLASPVFAVAYVELIDAVLNANYATVFQEASVQAGHLRQFLHSRPVDSKLLTALLSVLITMSRVYSSVCLATSWETKAKATLNEAKLCEMSGPEMNESFSDFSFEDIQGQKSTNNTFICRICEETVPLEMVLEHSELCIRVHNAQFRFFRNTEKLKPIREELSKALNRRWPGQHDHAIEVVFPVLYFHSLVSFAIDVQITDADGYERLGSIFGRMNYYCVPEECSNLISTFLAAKQFVEWKAKALNDVNVTEQAISKATGKRRRASKVIKVVLSDFEFLARISSGAFARVYLSRKRKTGDFFAIKVIKKEVLGLKNQITTVTTERDIMKRLGSQYVVNFFYSFMGKNNMYLVMEYIPGGDLYSLLEEVGSLSEEHTRTYAAQIVIALKFLRDHKVIHRDLKPDNLLVNEKGHLKLADFGLSFFGATSLQPSRRVGTPDYMAPEIVMAKPHQFEVDYWSLGAILFEMLAGVPPFHADDPSDTFKKIMLGIIPWDLLEDASPLAQNLIKGLLTFEPSARLGARDIHEIMNHPWFAGINWDKIQKLPPVFVPDTKSTKSYKHYFKDRYAMRDADEVDIREDLELAKNAKIGHDDVTSFWSVSLESLFSSNASLASKLRRRRRYSDAGQPSEPNSSLVKESPM